MNYHDLVMRLECQSHCLTGGHGVWHDVLREVEIVLFHQPAHLANLCQYRPNLVGNTSLPTYGGY